MKKKTRIAGINFSHMHMGDLPRDVVDHPDAELVGALLRDDVEVDEHCIAIARYEYGLSKLETRWGTFTDPWTHQPQPKCGFVVRGASGTIASYDYEPTLGIQTLDQPEGFEHPVEQLPEGERNAIDYAVTRLASGLPIEGPLSTSVARVGQQIIETTIRSVDQKQTVKLVD